MSGTFSSTAATPRLVGELAGSPTAPVSAFEARLPSYEGARPIPKQSPGEHCDAGSPFDIQDRGREGIYNSPHAALM